MAVLLKVIGVLVKFGPVGTVKSAKGGFTALIFTSKSKIFPSLATVPQPWVGVKVKYMHLTRMMALPAFTPAHGMVNVAVLVALDAI